MDVTIIGTGNMARGIGRRALAGGHRLTIVGKDRERAEAVASELREGGANGDLSTAVSGDPLDGDVIVLAVYYPDAREAVERQRDQLAGKAVVDITNPVNDSLDGLVVPPDSSATQELAALAPDARFVKAFNTTFANTLKGGEVAGQPLDVMIAGDDQEAKEAVATLARDGGLNPIDTGPQQRARELEALGLLHMTVQNALGTGFASAVKIIPPEG
jgi:8-hydroxy-5-deazaflavin:NADPH oxidoreductase